MKGEQIISALIGLAGAVSNTGKSENTDEVVRTALLSIRLVFHPLINSTF